MKISNPREARGGKRRVIKLRLVLHVIVIGYGANFLDQLERLWGKPLQSMTYTFDTNLKIEDSIVYYIGMASRTRHEMSWNPKYSAFCQRHFDRRCCCM